VNSTEYVCHGADGADGHTSLVVTTPEPPGTHCEFAGLRIQSGLDANANVTTFPLTTATGVPASHPNLTVKLGALESSGGGYLSLATLSSTYYTEYDPNLDGPPSGPTTIPLTPLTVTP